ncbi:MAG: hypothetical protein IRZ15_17450 [Bryobacteraceae bacterium]|nr:hypothetical protein [Bryobacteraceae bacterium]
MRNLLDIVLSWVLGLGGLGLFLISVLDSSILVIPFSVDLLVIVLAARSPSLALYYAAMAALGSVVGTLILDAIARKGGEEELEKHVDKERLDRVKERAEKYAGWVLALGALVPPPFPYKLFVSATAALQYPRARLMAISGVGRIVRFSIEGVLGAIIGDQILELADNPFIEYSLIALIIASVAASAVSLYRWIRQSGNGG